MAFVVLCSTMSFTIDMHYCGDTLVDTAIFQQVESCGMKMQKSTLGSECTIKKMNCCSDEQLTIEGLDELKVSFNDLTFNQQLFLTAFVDTYINLFEGSENKTSSFRDYSPPLVVKDIHKLDEVYII